MSFKIKKIVFDKAFDKKFYKYRDQLIEKDRLRLKKAIAIFSEDPFDSRLNTHKLNGAHKDYWSCRISYSDRIIFRLLDDGVVYLMDIGPHDVY